MESFLKKVFLTFHLCLIISLQIQGNRTLEAHLKNEDLNVFDRSGTSERAKVEHEMLMEFEHRKSRLKGSSDAQVVYTDLYVIEINDTERLKGIADKCGFTFIRKVFEDENYYLFRRTECKTRNSRSVEDFLQKIGHYSEIPWSVRQSLRNRDQRILPPFLDNDHSQLFRDVEKLTFRKKYRKLSSSNLNFNDPLFKEQWYLHNSGWNGSTPANDINVLPVWQSGITGRGVAISVLDDGVHEQCAEVAGNYDSTLSEEYLFRTTAFHPIPENSHGTRCAAIAAGVANNSLCGVGVAYEARVGGVRVLDGPLTDVQEAISLVHALNHVDIYTSSWGPDDKGSEVDGPKFLARMALIKGVTMGRQGKGSIYVWAAGNGGGYHDNCSLDGYASSPFTLTIGALTKEGRSTFYSEPCAAVIASTYIGGSHVLPSTISSLKKEKKKIKVVVPEGRGKCKETFEGTSAAAPMAAGVIALLLQANPSLTWRDVQHLIIRTSRIPDTEEHGWLVNGAGFTFHPKIGSGVLDAHALVTLARKWKLVGRLRVWTTSQKRRKWLLLPRTLTSIPVRIWRSSIPPLLQIKQLETVILTVNVRHSHRGDLEMVLKSPSSTPSPILTRRTLDNKTSGFEYWDFMSLHFWGEDPEGVWMLHISNHNERITGFVDYLTITLFGTSDS